MVIDRNKEEAMPPVRARGIIARAYLYMSSRYNIELSKEKEQLFKKWNKMYAPDKNECLRNSRIRQIQGHDNPFVSRGCRF
jgi:deoxyribonuclease-1